ncbi:MAG TPA: hypothetical protein DCR97_00360 [Deltaproteobacteria bacterium]|nr:hypothetical protein [Deltaproteobacteria bacterium]
MLIWPDCIACTVKMGLQVAREALKDDDMVMRLMKDVLRLESLTMPATNLTSPEIILDIWSLITDAAGDRNPLRAAKTDQNQAILQLYPQIKESVLASSDPFSEAVRFAIIGNAIDALVDGLEKGAAGMLAEFSGQSVDAEQVGILRSRVKGADRILYFTDNCGEIVFDRILIEVMKEVLGSSVTAIVRTHPAMNDASLEDARFVGLDSAAEVIPNGIEKPLAGTMLRAVSPRILSLIEQADILILKGGGNYDTMTEEPTIVGKTSYLFQAKCYPYSALHHVPVGSLVIVNN